MRFRPAIRAAYLKGQQIAQITLEGDFNFSFACGGLNKILYREQVREE